MARKGRATVKTPNREDRYIVVDSDGEQVEPTVTTPRRISGARRNSTANEEPYFAHELENVDPAGSREPLNLSKAPESGPEPERRQPRQASGTVEQSRTLADTLFPASFNDDIRPSIEDFESPASIFDYQTPLESQQPLQQPTPPTQNPTTRPRAAGRGRGRTQPSTVTPKSHRQPSQQPPANPHPHVHKSKMAQNMIQGGAYIPPGQQRNMRACMVCSIVRTQNQFLTQGCPNCEDIIELAGNPEQINDCTSQVFEGLITVADTSRSWVARYQRLEGYVPGVYATQVEGILPEDVIGAVESAGISYVPRDGSEQDMLPKD
jgi:transcription elongation factor SPT4